MSSLAYYIDSCSICSQGSLLICRLIGSVNLIIICDDCQSQWENISSVYHGSPLVEEYSRLVDGTKEEIQNFGWGELIQGEIFAP